MCYVMNSFLPQKIDRKNPRTWAYNLVYPLAVLEDFAPLLLVHDDLSFFLDGFLVATNTDY